MNGQIFREKSLKRVSSPEQLNEYIRVSSPGMWAVLAAVIVLLIGVCVWGAVGRLDTVLETVAIGENGCMTAYIRGDDAASLKPGMEVTIGEAEYVIAGLSEEPSAADDDFNEYALHLGGFRRGEWLYAAALTGPYTEGVHRAEITVDSVSPLFFIMN